VINVPELKCKRCGHSWNPRSDNPKMCPCCKSYKWNVAKEKGEVEHIMVSEEPESYNIGNLIKEKLREG